MHLMIYVIIILRLFSNVGAVTHWVLENNVIVPKPESPYLMKEPSNFQAFWTQTKKVENVENSFKQLLQLRDKFYDYLTFLKQYGNEILDQATCAMEYHSLLKNSSYLTMSATYASRLHLPNIKHFPDHAKFQPFCEQYASNVDGCFNKIQAENIASFEISPEEIVTMGDKKFNSEMLRCLAMELLNAQPKSWKAHLLGSYYWRSIGGSASEAIKCACRAVAFAGPDVKDIAQLSYGTILLRAGCFDDADVMLASAMQLEPEIAENHFTLGAALALKHDFNRSSAHFEEAERLDPRLFPKTTQIRNFITCYENLNKETTKMHSHVAFIKNKVMEFKTLKQQIQSQHEAVLYHQVPLVERNEKDFDNFDEIRKRGQYCSMRKLSASEEPALFCDFLSEMHVKLKSKELDISVLERDLKATSEAVIEKISEKLGINYNIYRNDGEKSLANSQKQYSNKNT